MSKNHAAIEAKKVYLKDASFESPSSPEVFSKPEITPELEVQMSMVHQPISAAGDAKKYYEVVLTTTVTAATTTDEKKKTMFVAEVQQAGIFEMSNVPAEHLEIALETACPHVLLPFARESLASLVSKGGFPQLLISPINFQALYHQKKAKEKAAEVHQSSRARPN